MDLYLYQLYQLFFKKNSSYYAKYLRDELMFLSSAFARENVSITGLPDSLRDGRVNGGVFVFCTLVIFFSLVRHYVRN